MAGIDVSLDLLAAGPWAYLLVLLFIAVSALFPPLPSESTLVTAMSLAAAGDLNLALVSAATTTGAFVGDLAAYTVGRALSDRMRQEAARSARADAALHWLQERQASWGPGLVVGGRFVPGGTTAVGLSAGLLAYPLGRFALAAAVGAGLWTGYGLALALLGSAAFPGNTWAAVLLTVGLALALGVVLHVVRRRRAPSGDAR